MSQKYSVNQYLISNILSEVQQGQITIPEIQRPFVWDSIKVRDLMDSLYQGYPIGYIITWKNPDVRLKDGSQSAGKKILIDGQQRITALRAAILGEKIVNKEYKEVRIIISFNPQTEEFATLTPAITKDVRWIADISHFLKSEDIFEIVEKYMEQNPEADKLKVQKSIQNLLAVKNKQIGFIDLIENLDIDIVTEIFIRINSKGVVLSQADFAMSKIASMDNGGVNVRKLIDYYCHLSREPKFFKQISENDIEFSATSYLSHIEWLKNTNDNLYDPDYTDVIRVAFTKNFERGKLADLVSLLSGRNFETREFEEEIATNSLKKLEEGVLDFTNQTNFERFVMIIKSAGFIDPSMISSGASLNFAYVLYLKLKEQEIESGKIEKLVKRWFLLSILTSRYSGSPESIFDFDIKKFVELGAEEYINNVEVSELSDSFWSVGLVSELNKSVVSSPFLNVFFASQVFTNDEGFLSTDIKVRDMILHRGDIHHLFPKNFLRKKYDSKNEYNQIANFVYAQQEINIAIGDKSPDKYMAEILNQCETKKIKYGNITDKKQLMNNLKNHCIPESIFNMTIDSYPDFLIERRKLMAEKIKRYYKSL